MPLLQNPPERARVHASAERTSPYSAVSVPARNLSPPCSRRHNGVRPVTAQKSASRCAAACDGCSCPTPKSDQSQRYTLAAWAAGSVPADDSQAAEKISTSCAPSRAITQTSAPPPARSSDRSGLLAAPAHTAPLCTPLRCSTKQNSTEMFDGTSLRVAWFCSARKRRSGGVYWSILTPALIRVLRLPYYPSARRWGRHNLQRMRRCRPHRSTRERRWCFAGDGLG